MSPLLPSVHPRVQLISTRQEMREAIAKMSSVNSYVHLHTTPAAENLVSTD